MKFSNWVLNLLITILIISLFIAFIGYETIGFSIMGVSVVISFLIILLFHPDGKFKYVVIFKIIRRKE